MFYSKTHPVPPNLPSQVATLTFKKFRSNSGFPTLAAYFPVLFIFHPNLDARSPLPLPLLSAPMKDGKPLISGPLLAAVREAESWLYVELRGRRADLRWNWAQGWLLTPAIIKRLMSALVRWFSENKLQLNHILSAFEAPRSNSKHMQTGFH